MQSDGNLVAYELSKRAIWATNTGGKGREPNNAVMQNDCNFVVYDSAGCALWASNTDGK